MVEHNFGKIADKMLPETGSLLDYPFPILMASIYLNKKSGNLHLERDKVYNKITFSKGFPIIVEAGPANLRIGNFLLRLGKISPKDQKKALSIQEETGEQIGEILIRIGCISPDDMEKSLKLQSIYKLIECFTPQEGIFYFHDDPHLQTKQADYSMFPENILWEGIKRHYKKEQITDLIQIDLQKTAIKMLKGFEEQVKFLGLSKKEKTLIGYFEKPNSVSNILNENKVEMDQIYQLVCTLYLTGIISLSDEEDAAAEIEPSSKPKKVPQTQSQKYDPSTEKVISLIEEKYLIFKKQSPFELLEVSEDASAKEIIMHFKKLSKIYHPDAKARFINPDIYQKAEEIFKIMSYYYAILTDPKRRLEWKDELLQKQAQKRDEIKTSAQKDFFSGKKLTLGQNFSGAFEYFEKAASKDPSNAKYLAWAGWSAYMDKKGNDKKEAANKYLQEAKQIDPELDVVNYFLGVVAKDEGNIREAEKFFKTAVRSNPDYIEAKREIRLIKMRRAKAEKENKQTK